MEDPIESPTTGVYIERLRRSLSDALHHLDLPNSDPSQNPLLHLDITAENATDDNLAPQDPESWKYGLVDVGNLVVNLALRYQEQMALLKTSHTSALLKHQVETKRLNDKLSQDQKVALTAAETSKNLRTENTLLQEQLRQLQLSSASKIDVLHQKIVYLEEALHSSKEKLNLQTSTEFTTKAPSQMPTADSASFNSPNSSISTSIPSTAPLTSLETQKDPNGDSLEKYARSP